MSEVTTDAMVTEMQDQFPSSQAESKQLLHRKHSITTTMMARHLLQVAIDAAAEGDVTVACHLLDASYFAYDDLAYALGGTAL